MLLCRCKHPLPDEQRRKIALFTNVEERAVISAVDADDIYKIPMLLHEQGLDDIVVDKLRLDVPPADLSEWRQVVSAQGQPRRPGRHRHGRQVRADPRLLHLAERSADARRPQDAARASTSTTSSPRTSSSDGTARARRHGRDPGARRLRRARHRGQDPGGALRARAAAFRTSASASGMQVAIIEFARHVLGLADAHSTEFNRASAAPGDRADHRVAGPGARRAAARRGSDTGRHHAPGRAGSAARRRHAWRASSTARDVIWSATAIATSSTTTTWSSYTRAGLRLLGLLARRPGRDHRAARRIPGSSRRSSTRSSPPRRATAIRCSPASSAPRAPAAPRSCRGGRERMKLAGYRGRPRPAAVPDRRTLRHRERPRWCRKSPGELSEITRRARHAVHLQGLLRQGQPLLGAAASAARASRRA